LHYYKNDLNIPIEKITLKILNKQNIINFLSWLEKERKNSISTRNQRLAAIHAFFRYIQLEEPVLLASCQQILNIPFKKHLKPTVNHLSKQAVRLILEQPNRKTRKGRRNLTILSILYDTGARVQEIVGLRIRDIRIDEPSVISLRGKGKKIRHVPLMHNTKIILKNYMDEWNLLNNRSPDFPLFFNYQNNKLTRAGICYIVKKYSDMAAKKNPQIIPEKITPHIFRHTKAMHLYQAGVNIIYIRDFLGHVDIKSTDIYARADTEMKRKYLEKVYPNITNQSLPDWNEKQNLLTWLNSLC
jgi:site-specific recombinase XerD